MYTGLTEDMCRNAWDIVRSSVMGAAALGITNKLAGTIVILDPHTGDVLFTEDLAPEHEKAELFSSIAHSKAMVSWETGMPSREVQQTAPHLYKPGWVKWGGAVVEYKLVVAFSGVQAAFDEAISWSVLAWILGMCRNEMTKEDGIMASSNNFIPFPEEQ